jgi:hypothetical protein
VTECGTEIDAKLVLGATATTAGRGAALGDRHVRERHQRDSGQKTTCDLPHIKPPVGVKNRHIVKNHMGFCQLGLP